MFQNTTINGSSEEMFINSTVDVLKSTVLGITKHAHFSIINQEFWPKNYDFQTQVMTLNRSLNMEHNKCAVC